MESITDFNEWLECVDPKDYEEVCCLYRAVRDGGDRGMYSARKKGSKIFVKGPGCDVTLLIASDKVKDYFLSILESKYCDKDMKMEDWYQYKRSMMEPSNLSSINK